MKIATLCCKYFSYLFSPFSTPPPRCRNFKFCWSPFCPLFPLGLFSITAILSETVLPQMFDKYSFLVLPVSYWFFSHLHQLCNPPGMHCVVWSERLSSWLLPFCFPTWLQRPRQTQVKTGRDWTSLRAWMDPGSSQECRASKIRSLQKRKP